MGPFVLFCLCLLISPVEEICVCSEAGRKQDSKPCCAQGGDRKLEDGSWRRLGKAWGPSPRWTSPFKPAGRELVCTEAVGEVHVPGLRVLHDLAAKGHPWEERNAWRLVEYDGSGVAPEQGLWEQVEAPLRLALWSGTSSVQNLPGQPLPIRPLPHRKGSSRDTENQPPVPVSPAGHTLLPHTSLQPNHKSELAPPGSLPGSSAHPLSSHST